jgi:beta-fructofuranosidase
MNGSNYARASPKREFPTKMHNRNAHHLPQYHVRLERGYLNDPNGPVQLDQNVHLYFQSRSYPDTAVPVEWGHASTEDLVHWRLHRPAMSPVPGGLDSGGCWSGNTVRERNRVRAFYSGKVDHSPYQSVLTALSDADGANFSDPVQVVEDPASDDAITMFRDPFVWKNGPEWSMVVGTASPDGVAAMRYYHSDDGLRWERREDAARLPRTVVNGEDTGEGWECPQVLDVGGRTVALVASWSHADGPGAVLAFAMDAPPAPHRVDDGHNFYAPAVMRDGAYGPLIFGWITEGRPAAEWQKAGWAGAISLPRRSWLDGDRLCTEPHPAVEALRLGSAQRVEDATLGAQAEILVPAVSGTVHLRFGVGEYLDVTLDVEAGTVSLDISNAGGRDAAAAQKAVSNDAFAGDVGPAVRIFLDGSVVEVFTSAGRSITSRVYPTTPPPWRIEAPEGTTVWELARTISPAIEKVANHPESTLLSTVGGV